MVAVRGEDGEGLWTSFERPGFAPSRAFGDLIVGDGFDELGEEMAAEFAGAGLKHRLGGAARSRQGAGEADSL